MSYKEKDEILKLFCLMSTCCYSCKHGDWEFISRKYILEKIGKLLKRDPIILDHNGKELYKKKKKEQVYV